jgi:endonuclease-3
MHSLFIVFKRQGMQMVDTRPQEVLNLLRKTYALPEPTAKSRDPFETLVVTIISQNTTDKNTARAFKNLSSKFRIDPETLANADVRKVEECLRTGGLFRQKAKAIKGVSRTLIRQWEGSVPSILSLPIEDARRELLQLPGVGPKTADVVLLFSARKPVIPVDTHVIRVSKRLDFAPENGDYETVRKKLETFFKPEDYAAVHALLILHGRKCCRARTPLCVSCPVNAYCPSRHLWDTND